MTSGLEQFRECPTHSRTTGDLRRLTREVSPQTCESLLARIRNGSRKGFGHSRIHSTGTAQDRGVDSSRQCPIDSRC
jgi:hypothetical protein